MSSNVIFGLSELKLTSAEIAFFKEINPCGYILFKRNIDTPDQLKELVKELRSINDNDDLLILIDQEGGRVRRLKPPYFRECKAAGMYAKLAEVDFDKALKAVELNHYLLGTELISYGINANCAPVADLRYEWAHDIVGDRSFGEDVEKVSKLCKAAIKGLNNAGVFEIIKHIPGHGRALSDSHYDLPKVETSLDELEVTDFKIFRNLQDSNFAMTAHIVYGALDSENCITHSSAAIDYIRNNIGFKGLIMSDDLSMEALNGSIYERAHKASQAGCDILLHCNGVMDEMIEVARAKCELDTKLIGNLFNKLNLISNCYGDLSIAELEKQLESYFEI